MTDYKPLPEKYRKTAPLIFNVDFFDFVTNAGYKKFYLGGTDDSVSLKYFLTTDAGYVSDELAFFIGNNATDIDFDITFGNNATIANAVASINYTVFQSDPANTFTVAWTIYHYDGSTETSLGTVTDTTSAGGTNAYHGRAVKVLLTEKNFSKGDILRVNAIITTNTSVPTAEMYIDPAGTQSFTSATARTITNSASVNIPFKIDL